MKNFEWIPDYSVNVKLIDDQHKYFISLLNEAYGFVAEKRSSEDILNILGKIHDYAVLHFKTEEEYFDKFDFAGTAEHKAAHKGLLSQLDKLIAKKDSTDVYTFGAELLDFLEDWLVHHLDYMDKKYVKCFNDHGLY